MPTTVSALLIVLFAVLPGLPGDNIYSRIVGSNWREEKWDRAVRVIGFSVGGLVLYVLLGSMIGAPLPIYIYPTTYNSFPLNRQDLTGMAWALSGHFVGAILISIVGVLATKGINRLTAATGYPDTWDIFVREYVSDHWVVVRLDSGESYAGILIRADVSVRQDERDVVLSEPAQYSNDDHNYVSLPYQHLFIPAALIDSVAVVHDPNQETRISAVGKQLFPSEDYQGGEK